MSGSLQLGDVVLGVDHSGASKPAISGPGRPSTASSRRASLASVGLSVEVGDGLDDMFCTTAVQLACMWDELGLSEAERDTAIRAFRARVEDVMESAVREFRGKVATAKKAIDGAADKILDMAKALGEEADLVRCRLTTAGAQAAECGSCAKSSVHNTQRRRGLSLCRAWGVARREVSLAR